MTAALVGVLAGLLAIIVYGLFAWEKIVHRRRQQEDMAGGTGGSWGTAARARAARPDTAPDAPRSFGPGTAWLAVRTQDAGAVVGELGLRTVLPANWRAGLLEVRDRGVFVSPAVDGWVFAVGRDLIAADGDDEAFVRPLLERISRAMGHAQWFLSDPAADRHGWALAFEGRLQRAYSYSDSEGHVWSSGEVTAAERAAGCFVDDPRDRSCDAVKWWPDLAVVRRLAAAWSLDPGQLEQIASRIAPGSGWVGRL